MQKKQAIQSPRGLLRLLYRLPIFLYRIRLGWLLGKRFLMLSHTGRKSGVTRRTVLEVVRYQKEGPVYTLVSAYGKKSDWYLNIVQNPRVQVQVGRKRYDAIARPLLPAETLQVFEAYNHGHPGMIFSLARMVGYQVERNNEGLKFLSEKMVAVRIDQLSPI